MALAIESFAAVTEKFLTLEKLCIATSHLGEKKNSSLAQ
jgi:hypothetical protein